MKLGLQNQFPNMEAVVSEQEKLLKNQKNMLTKVISLCYNKVVLMREQEHIEK